MVIASASDIEALARELGTLPVWARTAFAARCARRAQQLVGEEEKAADPDHGRAVELAIGVAERSAESGRLRGRAGTHALHAARAAEAAGHEAAALAAWAAWWAADSAGAAAAADDSSGADAACANSAALAVRHAIMALEERPEELRAIETDLRRLRRAWDFGAISFDTPIGPRFFSPPTNN